MSYSSETSITTSCANDGNQASLWQWIVTDSTGDIRLQTTKTICRWGEGIWNSPPECPYPACKDDMCRECLDGWSTENIPNTDDEGNDSNAS